MIRGIGTDIVKIARIRSLIERWGDRFARRILGPDELQEFFGGGIVVASSMANAGLSTIWPSGSRRRRPSPRPWAPDCVAP